MMGEHLLLQLAIILALAKVAGELCERWLGQPAVVGEIGVGVLAGTSLLRWVNGADPVLGQLAEIGAILLLFEIGLECDLAELRRAGGQAMWVACVGVILPMAFGYATALALGMPPTEALFVGAVLTATSVGITARVFADLHILGMHEAQIVLGAAVIDDVIGLVILAAMSGLAAAGAVSIGSIGRVAGMAVVFLVGALTLGMWATPFILRCAERMRTRSAIFVAAMVLCLVASSLAEAVRLAPIVGAFAAGLVLAKAEHRVHFEARIRAIADVFVPVFFVMMGARVDLSAFAVGTPAGRAHLAGGLALVAVAAAGKVLGGLTVPGRGVRRWLVGVGMIPRGEVGLIFARVGQAAGIIDAAVYADAVFVVLCTTLMTPPLLKALAGRPDTKGGSVQAGPPGP